MMVIRSFLYITFVHKTLGAQVLSGSFRTGVCMFHGRLRFPPTVHKNADKVDLRINIFNNTAINVTGL